MRLATLTAVLASSVTIASSTDLKTRRKMTDEWGHILDPAEGDHMTCSSDEPGAAVYSITDGQNDRCFVAVPPAEDMSIYADDPRPVMLLVHGATGGAADCGDITDNEGYTYLEVAKEYGFWIVCPEAQMYEHGNSYGGLWNFPLVQTDETGPKCEPEDSLDNQYFINLVSALDDVVGMDATRLFTHGCSSGSSMSLFLGTCLWMRYPERTVAMAPHSTGLKIKGDGNSLGCAIFDGEWGECEDCQYFPVTPIEAPTLKACIFDGTTDPSESDPYFYRTSLALASAWEELGNPYEEHYSGGQHCELISVHDIVQCLDDGTGRLTGIVPSTTSAEADITSPSNADAGTATPATCSDQSPFDGYTCAEWKSSALEDICSTSLMQGYCCKTCHDCHPACESGETTAEPTTKAASTILTDPLVTTGKDSKILSTTTVNTRKQSGGKGGGVVLPEINAPIFDAEAPDVPKSRMLRKAE